MELLDHFFSPELRRSIIGGAAGGPGNEEPGLVNIRNIHRDLSELLVAGVFTGESRHILWITGENENPREKRVKLKQWLKALGIPVEDISIHFYTLPFEDPYIHNSADSAAIGRKTRLASALLEGKRLIVLTTLSALSILLEEKERLPELFLELVKGGETGRDQLLEQLTAMGYRSRTIVEEPGDMAWRGSIVDIFPIGAGGQPVRIEIEAGTVISMRIFDPDTQKSVKRTQHFTFPVSRFFMDYESVSHYFTGSQKGMQPLPQLLGQCRVIVSDIQKVTGETGKLLDNYERIYHAAREDNNTHALPAPRELFSYSLAFPLENSNMISIDETWDNISTPEEWVKRPKNLSSLNLEDIHRLNNRLDENKHKLFVFSSRRDLGQNLEDSFTRFQHIPLRIPHSFENRRTGCVFLADRDFQYIEKKRRNRPLPGRAGQESLLKEIQVNDMVVHLEHGIGRFTGFKKLSFEGHVSEFLKIEYQNREYLYVPVYQLDVLSKYAAFEGCSPKPDRLGGNTWAVKQKKAKKSIITFARELLELYAMRKAVKGHSYPRDIELEEQLGAQFRYVETGDQKRAIKDVMADLEAEAPMDRLICGDVSFGKTEVALRAALRVVANGKQVALMCPTTILAYQHYSTFMQRFSQFPISIAMLSRMVPLKQKKKVHEALAAGKLDIVIGTHSLITRDICFKRLGLYIIDEEQRFGVFQKEKLKTNREDIDVLSLSATPIPRTLSLSLAGLQDISTIRTPPIGRQAIKNYVGYFSREIIMSAVLKEIERDGSVFIVYNDIERIYTFKEQLEKWLPQVAAEVIHARMKTQEIETNLMNFIARRFRVLISTTIIENGIDIPNVNTLIVLDADRFGLTQLYQLRGRIGRGNRQAYAYFLVRTMSLSDKARARLDAIREFADLGAGYKLAEFDLKLRGAGSLLGNRQHGHIEALGFDYYHSMLVKTVKELKGEIDTTQEGRVNIHFSYAIDSSYIRSGAERISLYRRILEADKFTDLDELRDELEDRYGRLPESIEKIFYAGIIRVLVRHLQIEEVDVYLDRLMIKFRDPAHNPGSLMEIDSLTAEQLDDLTWELKFPNYKEIKHHGFIEAP